MHRESYRTVERGHGGYHTRLPANYDLLTDSPIDGRSVGQNDDDGSGQFAAVLPNPLHVGRMAVRLDMLLVTIVLEDEYLTGTQEEIVAAIHDYAARQEVAAEDMPAAAKALAVVVAEGELLTGMAAEGHHHHCVRPAERRVNVARNAGRDAAVARQAAELIAELDLPVMCDLEYGRIARPIHNGHRDGVLI